MRAFRLKIKTKKNMAPCFHKIQQTNKLLFITLIIISFSGLIGGIVTGLNRDVEAPQTVVDRINDSPEMNIDFCSLADVVCDSEKAPVLPQTDRTLQATSQAVIKQGRIVVPDNLKKVFKKVCDERGFKDESCWKTLGAMAWKESNFDNLAKGDWLHGNPRSIGLFQIQYKMHRLSLEDCQNPAISARWTLEHLIERGWPTYKTYSIVRHNGYGPMAEKYAQRVKLAIASIQ